MSSLAAAYQYGQGTTVDLATAVRLFKRPWEGGVVAGPEARVDSGMELANVLL